MLSSSFLFHFISFFYCTNHNYSRNEVLYQNDSIATSLLSKGAKGVPLYSNPIVAYEVWTNLTSNIVEVGYRTPYDNMVISFSMPGNELKWKFSDDAKQKFSDMHVQKQLLLIEAEM